MSSIFTICRQLSSLTFAISRQAHVRSSRLDRNTETFCEKFTLCTYTTRSMATTAAAKNEFLCIIPDKPGTLAKRLEVRPSHLSAVKPLVDSGIITFGGALLESHPAAGETPAFKGSAMLAVGETAEAVKELLREDIYTISGVWDLDNTQIIPFKTAVFAPTQ